MCGICGELTFDARPVSAQTIVAMRDRLEHRGPDDKGVYVSDDGRAGLGFRRLAIIDLSPLGSQPMANEDGAVRVAFNGEIYNFKALRSTLVARGHQFRSRSDTEVLVHLYEDVGPKFVEEIDGMFAIALLDARAKRLVLARDRAGKKPLYVYQDARRLVFGSEIKAIFAHPDVKIEIDERQVGPYFTFGYVPHPATFYRRITQVDPAGVVVVGEDGRVESRRYWQLSFPQEGQELTVDRRAAAARVRELVTDAVSRRLVSDVPLGAFLSAGIDSTIVVGVMSRLMDAPVRTFTIGFEDAPAFDETAAARRVAERFKTQHTEFRVKPSAVDLIDKLIWHHDGPFGDSSAIPTYLVSQLTRQHVTVVLTGDGGDELFAGYMRFQAALAADRVPAFARPLAQAGLAMLPDAPHERHILARARRFVRFMHLPLVERLVRWNSIFQDDLASFVDGPGVDPLAHLSSAIETSRGASPLNRLLAVNHASYLPDDLLVKTDRMTMANSLEARSPLLDTALSEYAASLPDRFKVDGRRTKAILRDAFSDLLPAEIDRRPKTGFGVPLDAWFRNELRDYVRDQLLGSSSASHAYLKRAAVERLIDAHQHGGVNAGHRLWALVCFERWLQQYRWWTGEPQPRYHVPSR
ncbi:MAG TPA: asparagine synthase (glutamine-hydrolyzing) [Vicinamibacterales bacterium]|nr:asparagine synthase (glutamine-hydrolyzing) [Vicinamibacterales bacterium]